jgi:hypothetical protein
MHSLEYVRLAKKASKLGVSLYKDEFGYWILYHDERASEQLFHSLKEVDDALRTSVLITKSKLKYRR